MDFSVYFVLALLACCQIGLASSDFDSVIDGTNDDLQYNDDDLKRSDYKRSQMDGLDGFTDQKFRHLGLGKRTLDFLRYQSKVGKRLSLLALIQDNIDKSQDSLTGSHGSDGPEVPNRLGARIGVLRRSLRNRQNNMRMRGGYFVETRGRRQKVDPYMYLIGVGK